MINPAVDEFAEHTGLRTTCALPGPGRSLPGPSSPARPVSGSVVPDDPDRLALDYHEACNTQVPGLEEMHLLGP